MSATTVKAPSTGGSGTGPSRAPRRPLGKHPLGALFSLPYAVYLAVVFAYPLGLAVWISVHRYFFAAPGATVDRPFVGFANYATVLADPQVRRAFLNVGEFLLINVPLTVILSLLIASALNKAVRAKAFLRVSYYIPYVTASVALVAVWLFLFNEGGLVNKILGPLAPDPSWLTSSSLAMPIIAVFVTWKQMGFFILIYLAALQNEPKELYESAAVDGATSAQAFRHVTIPATRPATALVVILSIIVGANLFTEPYLLTNDGGPDGASASPVLIMYQRGIEQGHPDVAAAIGVILVIGVLLVSLISRRVTEGNQ